MDADYDPRARRLNPLIDELVETLDEYWGSVTSAEDYLERKGRLRAVRNIIDQILDEPEWLEADLQSGAAQAEECWFTPEQFADEPAPHFSDEKPFDRAGPAHGVCFLYTDTGKLSHLYEGEPVDPYLGPLRNYGPYIYTLEKHFATSAETTNRVINAYLFEQLVPPGDRRSAEQEARWFVLCDPRGIAGGERSVHVASYADPARAVEVAELLSAQLAVRFVVARERRRWCTR